MRTSPRLAAVIVTLGLALGVPASGGAASVGEDSGSGPVGKAKLKKNGDAVPPADAPSRVRKVILAANEIEGKPYRWGGGHQRWHDSAYDCSGAVSYALHGAALVKRPLVSGEFTSWGKNHKGRWITVYARDGHVYAVIAGLRWESAQPGSGPRWSTGMRSSDGFTARHRRGL